MPQFRKKPVVIEAVEWSGTGFNRHAEPWLSFLNASDAGRIYSAGPNLCIETLEGKMIASPGDWIIRGVKGEFYPCRADIFAASYEPVTPSAEIELDRAGRDG